MFFDYVMKTMSKHKIRVDWKKSYKNHFWKSYSKIESPDLPMSSLDESKYQDSHLNCVHFYVIVRRNKKVILSWKKNWFYSNENQTSPII